LLYGGGNGGGGGLAIWPFLLAREPPIKHVKWPGWLEGLCLLILLAAAQSRSFYAIKSSSPENTHSISTLKLNLRGSSYAESIDTIDRFMIVFTLAGVLNALTQIFISSHTFLLIALLVHWRVLVFPH